MKQLKAADGSATLPLKEWQRPKRTVRTFTVKVAGKNVEAVTTKGERYTYLVVDGVDMYTDGLLKEGINYKVEEVKEPEPAPA